MKNVVVVDHPKKWPLELREASVISPKAYLSEAKYSDMRRARVFNLCRSYRYQSSGYYVSLLAEARGHRPLPGVMTIQDMKSQAMVRFVSDELEAIMQKSLKPLQSQRFTLSVYFGQNTAKRYDQLGRQLFQQFQAPLLRGEFVKDKDGLWGLRSINPIATNDIPDDHFDVVVDAAQDYFDRRRAPSGPKEQTGFDMAILHNPAEEFGPSDEPALKKFTKAAEALDFNVERITKADYGRLAEFDALFIRETTSVNHHTYRFARRAMTMGLVVIDDPKSILKCTNKVYLAELMDRNGLLTPKTLIINKKKDERIKKELGLPCILKAPDSSFSQGVIKVNNADELSAGLENMLAGSDLIIGQEFLPTDFDWRIGVLNGEPIYACKYYMADKHWQIYKRTSTGKTLSGKADKMPVDEAPPAVINTALKAANLIGNGLYGVDLKQSGDKVYIIEVNDNPSIDSGVEDVILKDKLYTRIMKEFLHRIEAKKGMRSS